MAEHCRAAVSYFGSTPDCQVVTNRAKAAETAWPDRLSMTVQMGDEQVQIRTQLVGNHWADAVSAAVSGAAACGVTLEQSARALAVVTPPTARLQPVLVPSGAVIIRDEGVASPESMDALFEVIRHSRASRRILLAGDVMASTQKPRVRQRDIGRMAAETCELAIFVGGASHHAVRGAVAAGMNPAHCWDMADVRSAAELLLQELRPGDLLFVKGRTEDHLTRAVLAQFGRIGCWTDDCQIRDICDRCPRLKPDFDISPTLANAAAAVLGSPR